MSDEWRRLILQPKPQWWKVRQRIRARRWRKAAERNLADRRFAFMGRREDFQSWDDAGTGTR